MMHLDEESDIGRGTSPELEAPGQSSCPLCSADMELSSNHLFEVAIREVVTVCDDCALKYERLPGGPLKSIPRETRPLLDFRMPHSISAIQFKGNVTFLFYSTATAKIMSICPTANGPVESTVSREIWKQLIEANPVLQEMRPDVEALLMTGNEDLREFFVAPIDVCYDLVKMFRKDWRDFLETDTDQLENPPQQLACA